MLGLDELDPAPVLVEQPAITPAAHDLTNATNARRKLSTVADNRPADVARALSGWLTTKES